jgi:hypothetical protein
MKPTTCAFNSNKFKKIYETVKNRKKSNFQNSKTERGKSRNNL